MVTEQRSLERWLRRQFKIEQSRYRRKRSVYTRTFKLSVPQPWNYVKLIRYYEGQLARRLW